MYGLVVDDHIRLVMPLRRHAAPVYALIEAERERFARWLPNLPESAAEQAERHRARRAALADQEFFPFVVEVDGETAGTFALEVDGYNRTAEIGYLLASRFEGRGIVTRCAAAVIDAAIGQLGVERFEIRCAPGNARSRAVARRLGFGHEGTLRRADRIGDRVDDQEVHGLLAAEWRPPTAP